MAKILVIENSRNTLELLETVLFNMGHEVVLAEGGRKGLDLFRQERPQVAILDLLMPDVEGVTVLKEIRTLDAETPVIILTGFATLERQNKARELGAAGFLQEGFSVHTLGATLDRVLKQKSKDRYLEERRLTPRLLFHFPVSVFRDGVKISDGTACDLSEGGCAIWSQVNIRKGDHVGLQLSLPDNQDPTKPLIVEEAEVRWTAPQLFGLKFISLGGDDELLLLRYLTSIHNLNKKPNSRPAAA